MAKAKTKTVEVTLDGALTQFADLGVNFTDAEKNLAKQRCAQDDPVNVLEGLLDERVGTACRSLNNYPTLVVDEEIVFVAPQPEVVFTEDEPETAVSASAFEEVVL